MILKILMVATLAVITLSIAAHPAAAQTCSAGTNYQPWPTGEGGFEMQCVAPPKSNQPAPFPVQGIGTINADTNMYPRLGQLPRTWDSAYSRDAITRIPQGSSVQYGQWDDRWGRDGQLIYWDPYYGWIRSGDMTVNRSYAGVDAGGNQIPPREIVNGGAYIGGWNAPNVAPRQQQSDVPTGLPATGGGGGVQGSHWAEWCQCWMADGQ